ncbi:hypothetical protein P0Y35_06485 [Kiritimatiellaeota bacterium B1221]|nr:hypothetical protein [Kiritimatiellaeota bacterium B1221]
MAHPFFVGWGGSRDRDWNKNKRGGFTDGGRIRRGKQMEGATPSVLVF